MAKQVPWNKFIVEEFVEIGGLTHEEEMVLRTRVAGLTVTEQAIKLGMSESSVHRIIKRLKIKYDNVQPYSVTLPPRKFSAKETYMDTH